MLIGYGITRGCPNLDHFKLIGQLKTHDHSFFKNKLIIIPGQLRDHNALVMSKPKVIV